jgi:glycosyltransferase involved in cell wall biosynthesis
MTAADVLLHPARVENTGLTLLESLACGLPVLCTAACGYATYIAESSGGIVLNEPFNQDQMNKALAEMLDRDQLKQYCTTIKAYRSVFWKMPSTLSSQESKCVPLNRGYS